MANSQVISTITSGKGSKPTGIPRFFQSVQEDNTQGSSPTIGKIDSKIKPVTGPESKIQNSLKDE